jgi:hypothetical protein
MALNISNSHIHIFIIVLLALTVILLGVHIAQMKKEKFGNVISDIVNYDLGAFAYGGLTSKYQDQIKHMQQYYQLINAKGEYDNPFYGPVDGSLEKTESKYFWDYQA